VTAYWFVKLPALVIIMPFAGRILLGWVLGSEYK